MSTPEEQQEHERREREYERRRRQEPLMVMTAIIASGMSAGETSVEHVAQRSLDIAQRIMAKVVALP